MNYSDISLEKLYLFLKYLIKKLPKDTTGGPLDILNLLDLEDIRVVKKMSGSIVLDEITSDILDKDGDGEGKKKDEDVDILSNIIKAVNKQWGAEFGEQQQKTLSTMAEELASDEEFEHVVKNSSKHGASLKFEGSFRNKYDDQFESDYKLWEQLTNNPDLRKFVKNKMFDYVLEKVKISQKDEKVDNGGRS